jgi:hydrogenase maturation protein HypF
VKGDCEMNQEGIGTTLALTGERLRHAVLAMGADMKNAVAMGYDRHVVLSSLLGPLESPEAVERFEQVAFGFPKLLGRSPDRIAFDLHPDMHSSRFGRKLAKAGNLPLVEVQHHHAHATACLAENGVREGLVLVMDGTGWGGDGTIWGAELLEVQEGGTFRRLATFAPVPLPGGDAAVRRPARQLIGRWIQAGIELTDQRLMTLGVTCEEAGVWEQQCQRQVNAPLTHAAGRLFDSVSALLGLAPREISGEGEPAILLESAAREWSGGDSPVLPFDIREENSLLLIDWAPTFRKLSNLAEVRQNPFQWAMAFHAAVARAAEVMIEYGLSKAPGRRVGLSGGVFLNQILTERLSRQLECAVVTVLRHRVTPPGDGCIALGQVVVAGS